MTAETPTSISLPDGRVVRVNDYVYLTSSWNAGDAYTVGRIIEFTLLPERMVNYKSVDHPATSDGGQELYARVNTFLRTQDLPVRISQDPRLLIGTMTADLFTVDSIRGLCTAAHRDWITARPPPRTGAGSDRKYSVESDPALLAWKKKEHHFFFYQLYERYTHKLFDILPVEQVTNAPPRVLETLRSRYSFVSTETNGVAGLTNSVRMCDECTSWIPTTDAVQCDACKKHWHLECITPRLTFHPMKVRGYRWTCAPCNRIHEERVHNEMVSDTPIADTGRSSRSRQSKPVVLFGSTQDKMASSHSSTRPGLKGNQTQGRKGKRRGNDSEPPAPAAPQRELRTWEGFPLRYFGQNSSIGSVTDEMDWPYPVLDPRLGARYQHEVPTWEAQRQWGMGQREPEEEEDNSSDSEERGGEATSMRAASSSVPGSFRGSPMPNKRRSTPPSEEELRVAKRARTKGSDADIIEIVPSGLPAVPRGSPENPFVSYETVAQLMREATETIASFADSDEENTLAPAPKTRALSSKRSTKSKSPFAGSLSPDHTPYPSRGGDETIQLIFSPNLGIPEATIDAYLDKVRRHTETWKWGSYDVDVMNAALAQLAAHPDSPERAFDQFCLLGSEDFRIVPWPAKDLKVLEKAAHSSLNLEALRKAFPNRSTGAIVRAFYLARNVKYRFTWQALRDGDSTVADIIDRPSTLFRSLPVSLSLYPTDTNSKECDSCHVTRSSYWLKGPPFEGNPPLCALCGIFWRCYASKPEENEIAAHRSVHSNLLLLQDGLGPMPHVWRKSPKEDRGASKSAAPKAKSPVGNGGRGRGRGARGSRPSSSPPGRDVPDMPDQMEPIGGACPVP